MFEEVPVAKLAVHEELHEFLVVHLVAPVQAGDVVQVVKEGGADRSRVTGNVNHLQGNRDKSRKADDDDDDDDNDEHCWLFGQQYLPLALARRSGGSSSIGK